MKAVDATPNQFVMVPSKVKDQGPVSRKVPIINGPGKRFVCVIKS